MLGVMSPQRLSAMLGRLRGGAAVSAEHPVRSTESVTASPADRRIIEQALPYTMTGEARLQAVIDGTRHCVRRGVPGAFVECGVWRGGSVLAMILTLQEQGVQDREMHLYDTFEGMTKPTQHDVSAQGRPALDTWTEAAQKGHRPWPEVFGGDAFDEGDVRRTLTGTGYPTERLHLVRGPVEETLPDQAPERIALLRLDTDWYESTRHELRHLYPRLVDGGVLIIDDYGHWEGCRQAVDEYFSIEAPPILLCRSDYTGRIAVKH
jgi:O-methyltransferase